MIGLCDWNHQINCAAGPPYDCDKCGWAPDVEERRKKKIREKAGESMKAYEKMRCEECNAEIELGAGYGIWDGECICLDCLDEKASDYLGALSQEERLRQLQGVAGFQIHIRGAL